MRDRHRIFLLNFQGRLCSIRTVSCSIERLDYRTFTAEVRLWRHDFVRTHGMTLKRGFTSIVRSNSASLIEWPRGLQNGGRRLRA
jgi:hypothetical protein